MPREPRSITKRRFKHWQRTRKAMVQKIGTNALNDAEQLNSKIEEIGFKNVKSNSFFMTKVWSAVK